MSHRTEQVSALIQSKVGEFLVSNFDVPDVLVTVTRVETNADLKNCKVLVSIMPESKRGTGLVRLRQLRRDIDAFLFRELSMHPVPKVHFSIDSLEAEAASIEQLLDSIADETRD